MWLERATALLERHGAPERPQTKRRLGRRRLPWAAEALPERTTSSSGVPSTKAHSHRYIVQPAGGAIGASHFVQRMQITSYRPG